MDRSYADLCLSAKMSSTSMQEYDGQFRDFVLEHTLDDIMSRLSHVPKVFYIAIRNCKRAKARPICSTNALFRAIDFLLNNGSYSLCEGEGILSKYTTEGYSPSRM